MAGVKISQLPVIPVAPQLTDIFPEVQPASGGTTYQTTFQQLYNLFNTSAGTVNSGTINQIAYYAATGNAVSGTSTIPTAVQSNITQLGAQSQALNMNTHLINNVVDPVSAQDAATKHYVDTTALNGTSVYAASAASLGTVTQSGSGPGATITNAGTQATLLLDGVTPPVGTNVLIKNTATGMTAANEGIYTVTNAGSVITNWVLTRATDFDTATEINNTGLILIQNGSTLAGTAWYNSATIVTVDTTNFSFSQFGNIIFPVTVPQGGTGLTSTTAYGLLAGGTTSTGNLQNAGTGNSGDIYVSGGAAALGTWTAPTGTGAPVKASSPSLVTPTLGAASATSINFGGNTLSNYVVSTFTPVLAFGGGSTGIVYAAQTGNYTRIGNIVCFSIQIALSNKGSSTGNATVTGLPITSGSSTFASGGAYPLFNTNLTFTSTNVPVALIGTNSSFIILTSNAPGGGGDVLLTNSNFANNTNIVISGTYMV